MFESSVVLDGTKTACIKFAYPVRFESSVVLDGTKTEELLHCRNPSFESSVVLMVQKPRSTVIHS